MFYRDGLIGNHGVLQTNLVENVRILHIILIQLKTSYWYFVVSVMQYSIRKCNDDYAAASEREGSDRQVNIMYQAPWFSGA